jgi:hypothetical protein
MTHPDRFAEPARPVPGRPIADRRLNVYIDGYNFYVPLANTRNPQDYELAWCNFLRLGEYLMESLSRQQPFAGCSLGAVKYFTATIPEGMPSKPDGVQRKHNWLDALNHESGGRVEVIHGTFRPRTHRFYIENDQLAELARAGIPIDWAAPQSRESTLQPKLKVHEEKQTDVMLAAALLTDAALGRNGADCLLHIQRAPDHRRNRRPTPAPCHAAVVLSADIDILPAAEMAAQVFGCPVSIAFAYPHPGYDMQRLAVCREGLSTCEIPKELLRRSMLSELIVLDGGRRLSLADFTRTHFQKANSALSSEWECR